MTAINNYRHYIENVKKNAISLRTELDTGVRLRHIKQESYIPHMNDCTLHPTTGLIAKQEIIYNTDKNFPSLFSKNLHRLKNLKEYRDLSNIIENKLNQLYPKTKNLRKFLINKNHVSLYFVRRKHKLNILSKIKLMLIR